MRGHGRSYACLAQRYIACLRHAISCIWDRRLQDKYLAHGRKIPRMRNIKAPDGSPRRGYLVVVKLPITLACTVTSVIEPSPRPRRTKSLRGVPSAIWQELSCNSPSTLAGYTPVAVSIIPPIQPAFAPLLWSSPVGTSRQR